jgi:2-phospho-L-lactate/phosphoenolpyruvate guanylyltransferase
VTWNVVLPVKSLADAKSRLQTPNVADLALAFARDTVAAVQETSSVSQVVVVSSEPRLREVLAGVQFVADPHGGLVAALFAGIAAVGAGPTALLLADLPALRPADLDAALVEAAQFPLAMVADTDGAGTTLLTALDPARLVPRFGPGSRAAHESAGHQVLDAAAGLHRDVDTTDDLAAAVRLGVGPATARALAALADFTP